MWCDCPWQELPILSVNVSHRPSLEQGTFGQVVNRLLVLLTLAAMTTLHCVCSAYVLNVSYTIQTASCCSLALLELLLNLLFKHNL